ncbi:MAG: thioredoxin domain-containing protein [Desulfomonile tiedjei]|uniref:Thioredoxin domain-containing protein n=1 Tax=Desulfomonile tiedjei TaxID=2358 RepID=A0A9D6Z4V1_9BACT|nr:thioredoxin domain-containing protein [Desulfomonile tiedjei]
MQKIGSFWRGRFSEWFRRRSSLLIPYDASKGPFFSSRVPFLILLALSLVGCFATAFLTYRHIVLVSNTGGVPDSALCRSHGSINCDAILLNDYATLFGYISSASLGFMGFVFVLWLVLNALFNERMRKTSWVFLIVYFFAAIGFSWYYVYVMMFEVDYICTWCLVVHAVNLLSLIVVLWVSIRKKKSFLLKEISTLGERVYFIGAGLIICLLTLSAATGIEKSQVLEDVKIKYEELANDPAVVAAVLRSSPTYEIPVSAADPVFGAESAPHSLVFFSDFQCPVCARTEDYLKKIVNANPGVLNLIFKNYPLSIECNPGVLSDLHPKACPAARAAYAAFILGGAKGFWAFGDRLFQNQKRLKDNPWMDFAMQLKLDTGKFQELLAPDSEAGKKIKDDAAMGIKLKLNSTPQVFFKGKRIPENFRGQFMVEALDELIKGEHPELKDFQLKRP